MCLKVVKAVPASKNKFQCAKRIAELKRTNIINMIGKINKFSIFLYKW